MLDKLSTLERWNAPTSRFFKPLVRIGLVLAAFSAALVAGSDTLIEQGVPLPPLLLKVTEIVGYVSAAIAVVGKLTVDKTEYEKQQALADIG